VNHPLGATWSYCNAGFTIAGRVIESLTGRTWDAAMRDLLYTPLGLSHTVTLPEEALLHRAAIGHVHEGEEEPRRAPVWGLPRSVGPAGLIASTVGDVLTFARMHLNGGVAPDETRLLTAESVSAMQDEQASLPDRHSLADSWGLGWFRLDWNGVHLYGHDGATVGQFAFLRVLPEQNVAVAMLTNGGHARDLYESLVREVFRELAGVEMVTPLSPLSELADSEPSSDITPHIGTYRRTSTQVDIYVDDGADHEEAGPRLRLTLDREPLGLTKEANEFDLVPVHGNVYVIRMAGDETWTPVTFYSLPDGSPYVHLGGRATPKVA
jgi:hypothetical protein